MCSSRKSTAIKVLEAMALVALKKKYPNFPYPPTPSYTDKTSNGLTKCIVDFLNLSGHHAERINSMGFAKDNRRKVVDVVGQTRTIGDVTWIKGNTQKGTADISATIHGQSVKIEVKCEATGDRRQSEAQKNISHRLKTLAANISLLGIFKTFSIFSIHHKK